MTEYARPQRACRTCGVVKAAEEFATSQSKRCDACIDEIRSRRCRNCGRAAGTTARGNARDYCHRAPCVAARNAANTAAYHEQQRTERAARTTRRCPVCDTEKPLTAEHWNAIYVDAHGATRTWQPYCRPCTRGEQRARYHGDPARRAYALERARQQREEAKARRAVDPEYDAHLRRIKREASARARERARERADQAESSEIAGRDMRDMLPAYALAVAFDAWVAAQQHDSRDVAFSIEETARELGTSARSVTGWRNGERDLVQFDLADRLLLAIDRLWWEVWTEDTVRRPLIVAEVWTKRRKNASRYWQRTARRRYGDGGPDHAALADVRRVWEGDTDELEEAA
ncbi:hypothetical protein [Paraconexibacter algicola]|uniref:Uncharacterized protein n=1 Tax=Paraconexibacter algicola TaxID=2133960 RepID=A0A2T4UED3_9ACTN|nr:hypothetical protein [Paraconexibacter algicola]PTL55782.1 hypothetical protein C7Y72_19325 [Paraconexibacter algicola]